MIDAVIRTGGKQYRVHEGSVLNVPTLDVEPGSRVELRDVLLVSNDGNVTVGTPSVDGAVVVAEVVQHGKGKKVVNFKYKAKVRYRRKRGHRQGFTTLSIREITANGVTVTAPERARRPEPEPAAPAMDMSARPPGFAGRVESETPVAEASSEEPVDEAPEAAEAEQATEETPSPRTRRRRSAESAESSETESE